MSSLHVLAGPEAAPTSQTSQTSQPASSPTIVHQSLSSSSGIGLSPASTASIAVFLSLIGLGALACAICWIRRRRIASKRSDEQPSEKAAVCDVEAMAESPVVPATPKPDVRWAPQIRSISGPQLDRVSDKKFAALPPKRARSPPPSIKTRNLVPDPYAKSAPAHTLSFSQIEPLRPPRRDLSPPVTPQALAVSGMETRSLGRLGAGSES